MKNKITLTVAITIAGLILGFITMANASLVTIGTAEYQGNTYKLIYDDDDNNHGGGGLVWLDYTNFSSKRWIYQKVWALNLGSELTVTLFPGFTTDIDWSTGWRLPETVDGHYIRGYEGDPDGDGIYTYTYGCNLANSELGHLFYTELGNIGWESTDGSINKSPPAPYYYMQNRGDFENLYAARYWSCTNLAENPGYVWSFMLKNGWQSEWSTGSFHSAYSIAVHPGTVVSAVPLPEAAWLLGPGLLGLIFIRRR